MPGSDLLEYKWAKKESFFQSPKSVRCTEMPWAWRIARSPPATQPYIVENRKNRLKAKILLQKSRIFCKIGYFSSNFAKIYIKI